MGWDRFRLGAASGGYWDHSGSSPAQYPTASHTDHNTAWESSQQTAQSSSTDSETLSPAAAASHPRSSSTQSF
jgi:hypothetical protein